MGKPTTTDIVKWAEQQPSKLHKGKGSSLTQDQIAAVLELAKLNKTQTEIAQAVGCDQGTVSRWLNRLTDRGQLATAYLRGQQFVLARKFTRSARAADILELLDRFKSIPAASKSGHGTVVNVSIGVKADRVKLITPTFASDDQQLSSG